MSCYLFTFASELTGFRKLKTNRNDYYWYVEVLISLCAWWNPTIYNTTSFFFPKHTRSYAKEPVIVSTPLLWSSFSVAYLWLYKWDSIVVASLCKELVETDENRKSQNSTHLQIFRGYHNDKFDSSVIAKEVISPASDGPHAFDCSNAIICNQDLEANYTNISERPTSHFSDNSACISKPILPQVVTEYSCTWGCEPTEKFNNCSVFMSKIYSRRRVISYQAIQNMPREGVPLQRSNFDVELPPGLHLIISKPRLSLRNWKDGSG